MQAPAPPRLTRIDAARPSLTPSPIRGLAGVESSTPVPLPGRVSQAEVTIRSARWRTLCCWVLLAAVVIAVHVPAWGDWIAMSPDSFMFLTAARSVAQTGSLPPERPQCPPGFFYVLAPFLRFIDTPWLAIRIAASLASAAAVILTYVLFKRRLGNLGALASALAVATSGVLLQQSATLLSEFAYLPISLFALWLIGRMGDSLRAPGRYWRWAALAGAATAASLLVRSIGIGLLLAGAAMCLLQIRMSPRRAILAIILFATPTALSLGAWELRQAAYPPTRQYSDIWSTPRSNEGTNATGLALQAERLVHYGPARLDALKSLVIPEHVGWRLFQSPWNRSTSFILGGLFVAWCVARLLKRPAAEDVYFLITLGIISLWPYQEGMRLAAPLLPIAWCYVVEIVTAGRQAIHRTGRIRLAHGVVITATIIAITAAALERAHLQTSFDVIAAKTAARLEAGQNLANWLDSRVLPGADLICVTDQHSDAKLTAIAANYLGRRAIASFRDVDGVESQAVLRELKPNGPLLVESSILKRPKSSPPVALRPSPAAAAPKASGGFTLLSPNQIEHWPAKQ